MKCIRAFPEINVWGGGGSEGTFIFYPPCIKFSESYPHPTQNINYYYTHHASNSIDNQKCEKHFG